MSQTIQTRAAGRLAFSEDTPVAGRLAACREFLKEEMEALHKRHSEGASGLEIARGRAEIVDAMMARLFECAERSFSRVNKSPPAVALVALGGYGRAELSPLSDIDVMFLFSPKARTAAINPYQEHLTREILYVLWDIGLKNSHATRSAAEVFVAARKDMHAKTALLEARFIAGSTALYETFEQAYRSFYTGESPKDYILARLEDQAHRRSKFGDTVFNQEPDIKNGVGGLRDYQNALWMAQVKFGITDMDELAAQHHLKAEEVEKFKASYDFLLRVRNELHFLSARATDILNLDMQPRIAWNLGYHDAEVLGRIERFMQDYYRNAQTIFRTAKLVESRLALTVGRDAQGEKLSILETLRATRFRRSQRIDGFVLRGGELAAESPGVFRDDPVRLIRVFRHCQQLGCRLGFHLEQLVGESLDLLAPVVDSPDAAVCFRSILSESGAVHPALARMHELGVLGRDLPEFDALTCFVQHEFYHRYTADVHTLNAIRGLDSIFAEAEPITLKYREVLHELHDPALIYLTLLLHDIGKARGIKGHSESGVQLAAPILERLRVPPLEAELVLFVIKNHLAMARFWQKRDIDDPKTAAAFAELVGSAERLRSLYIHTFCDARATSADLWNSYKDALHTRLYRTTLERLEHGAELDASNDAKKTMTQQELIAKRMPGISEDEVAAHFNLLPDRYFINTDTPEVALHIQMVNRLLKSINAADSVGTLTPIIDWHDDLNRSYTVVNVVTWDRAGLFYKLAGAFSVAGLNILGAKIISRADHIAIDTFYVVDPARGGIVQNPKAQETFARTVEDALVHHRDLYPDIVAQAKKQNSSRLLTAPTSDTILRTNWNQ